MYNVVAVVIEVAIIHLNTRSLMRSFDKLNSFLRNLNMPSDPKIEIEKN